MTTLYVMEARENYSADLITTLATDYASPTTQFYAGLSYDRIGRNIIYCANRVAHQTPANSTGFALWTGQTLLANAATYDGTVYKNHSIMVKNLGTDAVSRFDAWSISNVVPIGLGGASPTSGTITNGGSGYGGAATWVNIPLTGGSGFGACASITVNSSGVITGVTPSGGRGYAVSDVLGVDAWLIAGGGGSGFQWTVSAVSATSDGTWRRAVEANATTQDVWSTLNVPRIVDPRTGDVWAHHLCGNPNTCQIYLLRKQDSYQQIISPLLPIPHGGVHMEPVALTTNYLWLINQQNGTGASYLVGTPRTLTAAETGVDYLLPYPWFTWPYDDWLSTAATNHASRICCDLSNNLYVLSFNYAAGAVTRAYTLKKFAEPTSATPYNAATVGGGFTDITPWAASTGPNTSLGATCYNNYNSVPVVSKSFLLFLPASNNVVCITKVWGNDLTTGGPNSTNWANTRIDVTYVPTAGGSFDYHGTWLAGYLLIDTTTGAITNSNLAAANFALVEMFELDADVNFHSYDFRPAPTNFDYSLRWFFLALSPVTSGAWTPPALVDDPTNRTLIIQVKFVAGNAPVIVQSIWDTGWNTAYAAFGTAIGSTNVVTNTAENTLPSASEFFMDMGIYDATANAWWWSGQVSNMFKLNPAFSGRSSLGGVTGANPPFLRLSTRTVTPTPNSGAKVYTRYGQPS